MTKVGQPANLFFPFVLRTDLSGNSIGLEIGPELFSYGVVNYVKESVTGHFLQIYYPSLVAKDIVKIDEVGTFEWQAYISNGISLFLSALSEAEDGSVYAAFQAGAPSVPFAPLSVARYFRFDSDGNELWNNNYSIPEAFTTLAGIIAVKEGAVLSYVTRVNGVSTFHYEKLDANNNIVWAKTKGDADAKIQLETQDGGLLFAGVENSGSSPNNIIVAPYLLKTTSEGNLTPACTINPNNGVDLDLTLSSSDGGFEAWQNISISLTVNNTGTDDANDVVIEFSEPTGTVFQGGNEYLASQGSYNPSSDQLWSVGTIPGGGSATITFNLFTLQEINPIIGYAQVVSMTELDIDSTPGNGSCCSSNEDDESVITINPVTNSPNLRGVASKSLVSSRLEKVFPNPTTDVLNIVIDSPDEMSLPLVIYNSQGGIVYSKELILEKGVNTRSLHTDDLIPGIYILHAVGAQPIKSHLQFIKERN